MQWKTIYEAPEACKEGLGKECFELHPEYARQIFAQRLLRCIIPPWLSDLLQKIGQWDVVPVPPPVPPPPVPPPPVPPPPGPPVPPPPYDGPIAPYGLWPPLEGPPMKWGGSGPGVNCCRDYEDPGANVGIGYTTNEMECEEVQALTVTQADPSCKGSKYTWSITAGGGELSAESGLSVQYTAPSAGVNCPGETEITLICGKQVMDTLTITLISCDCVGIEIGYTKDSMALSEAQTLQVSGGCESCVYDWEITAGGGSLSAESGAEVVYTAPASGHGCPGNTTIALSCKGEVCDTLVVTINYDYAISFTYGDPELEIDQGHDLAVNVSANGTPLTWAVAGSGFTLSHAETAGTGNVLEADGSASGAATITITDCDGNVAVGYVRCTTGQWILKSNTMEMPGKEAELIQAVPWVYKMQFIEGNKKQYEQRTKTSDAGVSGCEDAVGTCEEAIAMYCADHPGLVISGHCAEMSGIRPIDCFGQNCRNECTRVWSGVHNCWYISVGFVIFGEGGATYRYYEWEC